MTTWPKQQINRKAQREDQTRRFPIDYYGHSTCPRCGGEGMIGMGAMRIRCPFFGYGKKHKEG